MWRQWRRHDHVAALPAGTYSITASPLSNHAGTAVSTAHVQPSTITVTPGSNAVIMVVYDPAKYTAALDVSIGDIPVLADELLDVTVVSRNSQDPSSRVLEPAWASHATARAAAGRRGRYQAWRASR